MINNFKGSNLINNPEHQSKIEAYKKIMKYHGLVKGIRRVYDQFMQNDLYDIVHSTNFTQILAGDSYYNIDTSSASVMYYQPVYTSAVKRPILDLIKNHPIIGASSACFVDLGCGRGKSLHVAKSNLQHITIIGIELNEILLNDARINLTSKETGQNTCHSTKSSFILANVNDVDYSKLLKDFDVVIVFNKNSFDKNTTLNTFTMIKQACKSKSLFYIYSNPVFEDLFQKYECVFSMKGWHKNWNTKTFKIL